MIFPKRFVGLHCHDGFSFADGLGMPGEHFDFALENGMDAMAITNHGHANSYIHAYTHAKKMQKEGKSFKFCPGVEFYLHPDLKQWHQVMKDAEEEKLLAKVTKKSEVPEESDEADVGLTIENEEETKSGKYYDPRFRRHHLVILAKNSAGLEKLFGLVSRGYRDGFYKFPRIDYAMLKEAAVDKNLIVSTACIGGPLACDVLEEFKQYSFDELVPSLVDAVPAMDLAIKKIGNSVDKMIDAVGRENFFLEIQFNKLPPQHLVNRCIMEYAKRTNIPLIATADSHYCRPEYWKEREIYRKLGRLNYENFGPEALPQSVDDLKAELYPKNATQMWEEFKKTTHGMEFYDESVVCAAIERTHDIAHQLIEEVEPDKSVKLPSYVIPKGKTAVKALIDLCKEGLIAKKLDNDVVYTDRLKFELGIIKKKNFCEYFLTTKKIVDIAKEEMFVGPGRGSSAASLVNYVLGITDLDPIKYELLFERFISENRKELPDIDIDFADRARLVEMLRERFGDENVIPISNYNTFKLKSLVKDISRFFGVPFEEVNDATRTVDEDVRKRVLGAGDDKNLFELKYDDAMKYSPKFKQYIDNHPEIAENIKVLLHQNRSLGKHAGGVIVSENIAARMPLIKSGGDLQSPWTEGMHFKELEIVGWVKFDLLGLGTMRIMQRTVELILKRHFGISNPTFAEVKDWYEKNLSPSVLNLDEPEVYKHIYHDGNWAGVFQVTERGAQKFFERAKPNSITDIAALTSIYRPGPLAAKVDDIYVKAKEDPASIVYEHPLVKQVLEKTYGTIIFQESLMALGNVVGGMTLDECDKMRKVITKRSMSGKDDAKLETEKLKKKFIDGAVERGLEAPVADALFEKIKFFSGYGFNKAHAVAYAIDSYQCAWLLTHYEAEWLCAYMESMSENPEKRAKAIRELKAFGYDIIPIDINYAEKGWTILEGKRFMPSFYSVKGCGEAAVDEIMANRPYTSVEQLLWKEDGSWRHSKFNKRSFESLIKVGAFNSVDIVGKDKTFGNYRQMHYVIIENMNEIKHKKRGRASFEAFVSESKQLEEWPRVERVLFHKEILGNVDLNTIIPKKMQDKLDEKGIVSIDDCSEAGGVHWLVVNEANFKKTKTGKDYLQIVASGEIGKSYRVYCWAWTPKSPAPGVCDVYLAELSKSDFGFSTSSFKMRRLNLED